MVKANELILADLAKKLSEALQALTNDTKEVTRLDVLAKEYERQIAYHTGRGDTYNAEQVAPLLNNTYSLLSGAKKVRDIAQADYDAAVKAYTDAKASILSPAEQQEIVITASSNAAIAQAEQAVKGEQAKSEAETKSAQAKANYAADTTKYILIGVAVLLILGTVAYFILKTKSKAVAG